MCCMLGCTALGGMCVRETSSVTLPPLIRAQCHTVWGADNKAAQIRFLAAPRSPSTAVLGRSFDFLFCFDSFDGALESARAQTHGEGGGRMCSGLGGVKRSPSLPSVSILALISVPRRLN